MSAWARMTAAEKTSAAETLRATMSLTEIAALYGTTKGAVAGARYRERRAAKTPASQPAVDAATINDWARVVCASFGVKVALVLDMEEKRSLYRGVRHVLWYLLAQLQPPETLPGPCGSWRKRRDTDGMSGSVSRAFGCAATTIREALPIIEDMREDDPVFDAKITELEQKLGLA